MAQTISGTLNEFRFIGSYSPETGVFTPSVPEEMDDFIFDMDEDGICYVTTEQKFKYDNETGAFYLIREVK